MRLIYNYEHKTYSIGGNIVKKLTSNELRKLYLDFWSERKHVIIEPAPLIPKDDNTVLFTTAGMQQLVSFFNEKEHQKGKMLTDIQRCVRTVDIDDVGDLCHLTCFEMLGAWSLGAYWKKESVKMTFEFLTNKKYLGIPKEKLYFSVFEGDSEIPRDIETYEAWCEAGADSTHIQFLSKKENFWELGTGVGPCGTDTEIFYDTGKEFCSDECGVACDCKKFIEIGNNVLIQFNKDIEGNITLLPKKSIDQGLGFERILMLLNGVDSAYDTDLFTYLKNKISELSGVNYEDNKKSFRIIMDHVRSATFILGNNSDIKPSNKEQGYVIRRLIRRAIRHLKKLGVSNNAIIELAKVVIDDYKEFYEDLYVNADSIFNRLSKEELAFNKTLQQGIKEYKKMIGRIDDNLITGKDVFRLFDTFGFPLELTIEIASEDGLKVDIENFYECYKEHQEKSRNGSEQKFKGGLASMGEIETKYHTATHLLNAALKQVLGNHVHQKGSNITNERLRFDFSHDIKMTSEEINKTEELVNNWINQAISVEKLQMKKDEAIKQGAEAQFIEKYENIVSVYKIGDVSLEVCGGPHVENTKELGKFKIVKEEASSSGVRRIKAKIENTN